MVCTLITNIARSVYGKKGEKTRTIKLKEFLPPWVELEEDEGAQSLQDMKQLILSLKSTLPKKEPPRTTPPRIRKKLPNGSS